MTLSVYLLSADVLPGWVPPSVTASPAWEAVLCLRNVAWGLPGEPHHAIGRVGLHFPYMCFSVFTDATSHRRPQYFCHGDTSKRFDDLIRGVRCAWRWCGCVV